MAEPATAQPPAGAVATPGWELAGRTDQGRVRNHNEDSLLILPELRLICVCDGMGGHASGEVASGLAIDTLKEFFTYALGDPDATWPFKLDKKLSLEANRLAIAIRLAASKIFEKASSNERQRGMGTTVVACTLGLKRIAVAHAGDSRGYLFRTGKLEGITRDHSLLQEYIAARKPSPEEIANFPHKNVITRALGLDPNVRPDVSEMEVHPGDVVLLCSDGLHGMINDQTIVRILSAQKDLGKAALELIDAANAAGGSDNVSVVLARAS